MQHCLYESVYDADSAKVSRRVRRKKFAGVVLGEGLFISMNLSSKSSKMFATVMARKLKSRLSSSGAQASTIANKQIPRNRFPNNLFQNSSSNH
eukprot:1623704-Amphidinium_carterae.1